MIVHDLNIHQLPPAPPPSCARAGKYRAFDNLYLAYVGFSVSSAPVSSVSVPPAPQGVLDFAFSTAIRASRTTLRSFLSGLVSNATTAAGVRASLTGAGVSGSLAQLPLGNFKASSSSSLFADGRTANVFAVGSGTAAADDWAVFSFSSIGASPGGAAERGTAGGWGRGLTGAPRCLAGSLLARPLVGLLAASALAPWHSTPAGAQNGNLLTRAHGSYFLLSFSLQVAARSRPLAAAASLAARLPPA